MILLFEHRTHHPTRTGNHFVRVDDDGTVHAHQNATDPPPGREWTVEPDGARVGRIAHPRETVERVLRKHDFFEMDPLYESATTMGGVIRTLTYWDAGGVARTVTVDRAKRPDFDKLVQKLLGALDLTELPAR